MLSHIRCLQVAALPVQEGRMDDLARLLGASHLADNLSVDVMRDGVVAFEHPAGASAYRDLLEADGHLDVLVSEIDSHTLFRTLLQARSSLVVLMHCQAAPPAPARLAAALRQKRAFEDL
jgi:hypothetical protein